MSDELVNDLAKMVGGKITDGPHALPDGSGFAVMSMPLPETHWIYGASEDGPTFEPPPMPFRMGTSHPLHNEWVEKIRTAGQYAIRASTMNGREMGFDPDAMVHNLVVGMIGYWTADGLTASADDASWLNPSPVPPVVPITP